jgi:hypothetical protein
MSPVQIEGLRSEHEQARRLGIGVRTLRRWRDMQYGPAYTKIGRAYFYRPEAEVAFIAACERAVEPARPISRRRA